MPLHVKPFDGVIGAEVLDVDLAKPLEADEQNTLRRAWSRHSVLVFRAQKVTPDQFLRYSR